MVKNKIKKRVLQEISYASGKYLISPEIVSLVVTFRCNFKCQACTVWRAEKYPELSQAEWEKISDQLKFSLSKKTSIEISGGESMIRKDLVFFLINHLKNFFENVGINSNGYLLDEKNISDLKMAGVDFVKISLYGLKETVHDDLRGVPGSAKKAKEAIDLLQKQGIQVDIGVLITRKNISDIPNLINYYNRPGHEKISIVLQSLDEPIGVEPASGQDKIATIESLWPDKKSIEELFSWLSKNKTQKIKNSTASLSAIKQYYLDQASALKRRCFAGQRSLVIYPDGKLAVCYKGAIIGNMANENLKDILIGEKARKERLKIKKCPKKCRIIGCNFSKTIPEILGIR
ncbi:MAG TPA: radical SAM protein [Candidatus Moranbacteria bacterium]|nr:radical SAM protein [Candidatus Moranbacteria bacterium]